jgi:hypothetical protein
VLIVKEYYFHYDVLKNILKSKMVDNEKLIFCLWLLQQTSSLALQHMVNFPHLVEAEEDSSKITRFYI